MATMQEHIDAIKAAFAAAKADGYTLEFDRDGDSCCEVDVWLTINRWDAPSEDHPLHGRAKRVVVDWEVLLEEDEE